MIDIHTAATWAVYKYRTIGSGCAHYYKQCRLQPDLMRSVCGMVVRHRDLLATTNDTDARCKNCARRVNGNGSE